MHDGRLFFLFNVSSNVAYIVITTSMMLAYIPYLVRELGPAAYGVISLGNLIALFALCLCDGVSAAFVRNLAISLSVGDRNAAHRTFSSGIVLSGIIVVLCAVPAVLLSWYFPVLFQVPEPLSQDSQIFAAAAIAQVLIALIENNFASSAIVLHRFDLRNTVRLLTMITRIAVVVFCFSLFPAHVWQVGFGLLLSAVVSLAGSVLLWRHLTATVRFGRAFVDFGHVREMVRTGISVSFNRVGWVILIGSDLILINWFFDPVVTGHFGVLILVAELIRNGVDAVSSVLGPGILVQYARRDFAKLAATMRRSIKVLSLALSVSVGILCAFSGSLLELWLGPEFGGLSLALAFVCGHFSMTLGAAPLSHVLTAYDKVGALSAWTLALSVANFAFGAAVAKWTALGPLGVVATTACILILRTVLLVRQSARSLGAAPAEFLTPLFEALIVTIAIGVSARALLQVYTPTGWFNLVPLVVITGMAGLGVVFALLLDRSDRVTLFRLFPLRVRRTLRSTGFSRGTMNERRPMAGEAR